MQKRNGLLYNPYITREVKMSVQLTRDSASSNLFSQNQLSHTGEKDWVEESFEDISNPCKSKIQEAFLRQQIQRILQTPPQIDVATLLKKTIPQTPFDAFDPETFESQFISSSQKP